MTKSALFAKSSVILTHFYVISRHFWVKLHKKCPYWRFRTLPWNSKLYSVYAEVGMNGRNSDRETWAQSSLRKALEKNTVNLSKPTPLSSDLDDITFVCVWDDAFPLSTYMMKPYPQKDLSRDQRIFNYRLSGARRIPENVIGILANRWRVFRKSFLLKPEKINVIPYSVLILHNVLRSESTTGKIYIPLT